MKKISTFFEKDPYEPGKVINKVREENKWVFLEGVATRKFDGTACAIIQGELYRRFDLKKNRRLPQGKIAIPCQPPDPITGHHPHWLKCDRSDKNDKYHFEAWDRLNDRQDDTYELCGPKVQGNPEKLAEHSLIKHGKAVIADLTDFSFEGIKQYLTDHNIEGIVFHNIHDGRMCKIRKSDFGIKR